MLLQQNDRKMEQLRLFGAKKESEIQRANTQIQALSHDERLSMLLDAEILERDNKRLDRLIKNAKFKIHACPEDLIHEASRGLDREVMRNLLTCDFIERGQHVFITGPTGTGKTWKGCALGMQAVRRGYPVLYIRFPRFIEDVEISYRDGSLPKLRNKILKMRLLIFDDWALSPLTDRSRQELLEIIDGRSDNGSMIFTSQLPIENWHDYIGEGTFADAILDRVIHNSHQIKLKGESLRKQVVNEALIKSE